MTPSDLDAILAAGPSALVGTRDGRLRPEFARAAGGRFEDPRTLLVWLPDALAARTLANLRDNGRVAVVFTRIPDNRSFQAKGRALEVRPAGGEDRETVARLLATFAESLVGIGYPRHLATRFAVWPCQRLRIAVDELFVQTPGPGAGAALQPPGAAP